MAETEKNPYSKGEGFRELRDVKETEVRKTEPSEAATTIAPASSPDGYYKPEGDIEQSLFIIISGGDKRERQYFHIFKGEEIRSVKKFPRIHIEFISEDGQGLLPKQMLEKAMIVKASKRTSIETDKYYLVTDVDEFRSDLQEIIPSCKKEKLELIISNYCFEIWLYYGRFEARPTTYTEPEDKSKCSQVLKKYVHEESGGGGIDSRTAIFDIEKAIINSANNYEEDEHGIPAVFSTNMHKLAKEIHILIGEDLKKYIATETKKKEEYKNKTSPL